MAETEADNKTEQPTPRRTQDARKKGQVAKSREVSSALIMIACLAYFHFGTGAIVGPMMEMMKSSFRDLHRSELTTDAIQLLVMTLLLKTLAFVLPLLLTLMVAGVVANVMQVGLLFSAEPIQPISAFENPARFASAPRINGSPR